MTSWFVQRMDGNYQTEVGPLRPAELLAMVRSGEVTPGSFVRKDDSAWFEASKVGGLFEAAERPTVHYYCPQCETEVKEPPVTCPKCLRDIRKAHEVLTENKIATKRSDQASDAPQSSAKRSMQNWLRKRVDKK
ncbi:GYF domain-containing protein [Stieleria varia]|uniref:GYF domain-containing protein n=1 Tax=Stieleria varia TaxID=2528005 RepID=A0A5C6B2F2_9BACT|nr:GYF domain-containing protein [Stieleria varia]TWU05602.1 hypothetical protein Pla52n_13170 [Stieleria varia]